MRYISWKLNWPDEKYGIGPEATVASNGAHLQASPWVSPTVEHGEILGYLTGDIDISIFADWSLRELTQAEAVAFAQSIDSAAQLLDNGFIGKLGEVTFP